MDRTAKSFRPKSTPAACPVAGSGSGTGTSTCKTTNQRPAGSLEMVTDVGSSDATSMPGHVHTKLSGAVPFASRNAPSFIRNADRV